VREIGGKLWFDQQERWWMVGGKLSLGLEFRVFDGVFGGYPMGN
jgi:hypothetical protein